MDQEVEVLVVVAVYRIGVGDEDLLLLLLLAQLNPEKGIIGVVVGAGASSNKLKPKKKR